MNKGVIAVIVVVVLLVLGLIVWKGGGAGGAAPEGPPTSEDVMQNIPTDSERVPPEAREAIRNATQSIQQRPETSGGERVLKHGGARPRERWRARRWRQRASATPAEDHVLGPRAPAFFPLTGQGGCGNMTALLGIRLRDKEGPPADERR